MAATGEKREQTDFVKELFVGITGARVASINPTLEERCELFGVDYDESKKEIMYLDTDKEGNDRLRIDFWLKDLKNSKFYRHNIYLANTPRVSKDGLKVQLINNTCNTTWVPYDGKEADMSLVPEWFLNFTDKKDNNAILGPKKVRIAMIGEEELGNLARTILGDLNFFKPSANVMFDINKLFSGDYSELRADLIDGDYATPVTATLGVETDDELNKRQKVWKTLLPAGFVTYIGKGFKFPSDYTSNLWKKFEEDITGEYGFKGFTQLVPIKPYNEKDDLASTNESKAPEPQSSDY